MTSKSNQPAAMLCWHL